MSLILECPGESPAETAEREDAWSRALTGLSERQRVVIILRLRRAFSLPEIGVVLGVTKQRIAQIFNEAIELMKTSGNWRAIAELN